MLFIIEGIDGSGKSTLVTELAHELSDEEFPTKTDVLHSGPLEKHPLEEYLYRIANYDPHTDHVIADRWHIGELIYGPLYRGESQLTPAMRRYIDLFLESRGAVKLHMGTSFKVVETRIAQRGEKFLKPQHRRLVFDRYEDECSYLDGWTTVGSNWRSDGSLPMLVREGARREFQVRDLLQFKTYVGPPRPDVLILGDVRGMQRSGRPKYRTAFVPYKDTSGHYLLSAIEAVQPKATFGLANAGEENIPELLEVLDNPRVICLGRHSESEIIKTMPRNYPYSHINHPSHVMRFSAGAVHEYGSMLGALING